jgi:hypothetical protein
MPIAPRTDAAGVIDQAAVTVETDVKSEEAKIADDLTNELKSIEGEAIKLEGDVKATVDPAVGADAVVTIPPANEFPQAVEPAAPPVAAPAPVPVMASTGNANENALLKDIVLADLPTIAEAQAVAGLKEGDLFIAAFLITPGSDGAWHASQIIGDLLSGRAIKHGLSQAYWQYHYKNRPPIAQKKGTSYTLLD